MKDQQTFSTLIRRRYDGSSYSYYSARREGREFAYVDVTIRVEVREWVGGFPLFGLCVAAAPATDPRNGRFIFQPEDEVTLNAADVRALRRECADYFSRVNGDALHDPQEYTGPGADELVDFLPNYDDPAELAEANVITLPDWWHADAA